jgi:hypothetical protein
VKKIIFKLGVPITVQTSRPVRRGRPPIGERAMTKAEIRKRYREREREQRPNRREEERELARASGNALPFDEQSSAVRGQSETARAIEKGLCRLLRERGCLVLRELILPSGKRADIVALRSNGEIWIIEIKSSLQDFRIDRKWSEYHDFCNRLFFAITPNMKDVFPERVGLVRANRFGGEIIRIPSHHRLLGAHRMNVCVRKRIIRMARCGRLSGNDYAGFVHLTQREIRPELLGEWWSLLPEQRQTIQQAKIFARDASKRYLFQSRRNRHELILDWLRPHVGVTSLTPPLLPSLPPPAACRARAARP